MAFQTSPISHVVLVDEEHVGLSNQFFATTAANLAENPHAAILLVDGTNGNQCRLRAVFVRTIFEGPLFSRMSSQLGASSSQVGMTGIMRLRGVDIFRVESVTLTPAPSPTPVTPPQREPLLTATAEMTRRLIAPGSSLDHAIDELLAWMRTSLGCDRAVVFMADHESRILTTAASLGYERSGVGSEIAFGSGIFGGAAATGETVKISDLSRTRRYGEAVRKSTRDENLTRTIAVPMDPDSLSQIAVPMIVHGELQGVLGAESRQRLAFTNVHESALIIAAQHLAALVALSEAQAEAPKTDRQFERPAAEPALPVIEVRHFQFDDSIFIAGDYIIKGIAGRLLNHILRVHLETGRLGFTNRELRLEASLRLPEFKDNLETRLLLLRRRLADKASPIQLVPVGRGEFLLQLKGRPVVVSAEGPRS
ncbi:GAF domain-containing protein [Rhizobium halophilum]|uniref:GAF domain-containing protein n=1 Tax=Rhizobium halophilum TaxID=2846852 RepID=UPI001EFEC707|nr:GAF domain-containing protein [Rhizobium halophilum]MCF6367470.1 GAF domain-containing protein [Rhizobium halophilum]